MKTHSNIIDFYYYDYINLIEFLEILDSLDCLTLNVIFLIPY